jgi:hypothetical protein
VIDSITSWDAYIVRDTDKAIIAKWDKLLPCEGKVQRRQQEQEQCPIHANAEYNIDKWVLLS